MRAVVVRAGSATVHLCAGYDPDGGFAVTLCGLDGLAQATYIAWSLAAITDGVGVHLCPRCARRYENRS